MQEMWPRGHVTLTENWNVASKPQPPAPCENNGCKFGSLWYHIGVGLLTRGGGLLSHDSPETVMQRSCSNA
jgi:hypothetical protein